jgi:hypothetical protein
MPPSFKAWSDTSQLLLKNKQIIKLLTELIPWKILQTVEELAGISPKLVL